MKKITIAEVAEKAGVSRMTVYRVLNGRAATQASPETIAKIQTVMSELRYVPRHVEPEIKRYISSVSQKDSPAGRLIVPMPYPGASFSEERSRVSPFESEVVTAVMEESARRGIPMEILPLVQKNDPMVPNWELIEKIGPDCRILGWPWFLTPLLVLSERGCRIAVMTDESVWRDVLSVQTGKWAFLTRRNIKSAADAVRTLWGEGFRKIATVAYSKYSHEPHYPRVTGYLEAMKKLHSEDSRIIEIRPNADVAEAVRKAYAENPFDALLFHSAPMFSDPAELRKSLGLPEKVPVVLWKTPPDFHPGCNVRGMRFDSRQIGRDAVEMLCGKVFVPSERLYQAEYITKMKE